MLNLPSVISPKVGMKNCTEKVNCNSDTAAIKYNDQVQNKYTHESSGQLIDDVEEAKQKASKSSQHIADEPDLCLSSLDLVSMPIEPGHLLNVHTGLLSSLTETHLHYKINSYLSLKDNINQAEASKFHHKICEDFYAMGLKMNSPEVKQRRDTGMTVTQIFAQCPGLRKDCRVPEDAIGRAYLDSLGIGGPLTNPKIISGALTIEEALAKRRDVISNFKEEWKVWDYHGTMLDESLENGYLDGTIKYVVDGSLAFDDALALLFSSSIGNEYCPLNKKSVMKYIDNGLLLVEQAINELSSSRKEIIDEPWIQKYIDNGMLTMEQFCMYEPNKLEMLVEEELQKCLDNGFLTMAQAFKLPIVYGGYPEVEKFFTKGLLNVEQFMKLAFQRKLHVLKKKVAQEYLNDGLLTIEKIIKLNVAELTTLLGEAV